MKTLSLDLQSNINGGGTLEDAVVAACGVIGAGSLLYMGGIAMHWWNPIGWLSATLTVADLACIATGLANM